MKPMQVRYFAYENSNTEQVTVDLPVTVARALYAYAAAKKMTLGEALAPLLEEFLERQRYLDPNRNGKA